MPGGRCERCRPKCASPTKEQSSKLGGDVQLVVRHLLAGTHPFTSILVSIVIFLFLAGPCWANGIGNYGAASASRNPPEPCVGLGYPWAGMAAQTFGLGYPWYVNDRLEWRVQYPAKKLGHGLFSIRPHAKFFCRSECRNRHRWLKKNPQIENQVGYLWIFFQKDPTYGLEIVDPFAKSGTTHISESIS